MLNTKERNFVDVDAKTCYFGAGAIHISISGAAIVFREVKPPIGAGNSLWDKESGAKIGDWEWTDNILSVHLRTMADVKRFNQLLDEVEGEYIDAFGFDGVILDFSFHKQASVDLVRAAADAVRLNILPTLAC